MATPFARLGPRELALLERFQRSRRAVVRLDRDPHPFEALRPNALRLVLKRLADGGWLRRLERGAYLVTGPGRIAEHSQLAIAADWLEGEPYVVGGLAALAHWNLIGHSPTTVDILLARRKPNVRETHTIFRFIYVPEAELPPARTVGVAGARALARVAEPEHALIHVVAGRYAATMAVVGEALRRGLRDRVLRRRYLIRALRHSPAAAARRLGWLAERQKDPLAEKLRTLVGTGGYVALDPRRAVGRARRDRTWRVLENIDADRPVG